MALVRPTVTDAVTAWTPQPVAIALAVLLAAGYVHGLRRRGGRWPRGRIALFGLGLLLLVWGSCGFPQVYNDSLYWVWTSQTLLLWLLVPIVIMSGYPVQLAQAVRGPGGWIDRVLRSRPIRVLGNPLVGPALVPILSFGLFFGPLPDWSIRHAAVGWLVQLVVLAIGVIMVLPLVGLDDDASSLAVGLSVFIGCFELVLDALPGVILRLHTRLVTSWFDHRAVYAWTPDALRDQRLAGAILWCIAELIDLPFLVLVYRRWLRIEAREAAEVDAVLDAERAARGTLDEAEPDRDVPWWLSDPEMQERLRRYPE